MGNFRFRRSISIIPGVKLNIGKRGVSVSAGIPGAHVTIGKRGTQTTIGIPGTGMSYTNRHPSASSQPTSSRPANRSMFVMIPFGVLILSTVLVFNALTSNPSAPDSLLWVPPVLFVVSGILSAFVANCMDWQDEAIAQYQLQKDAEIADKAQAEMETKKQIAAETRAKWKQRAELARQAKEEKERKEKLREKLKFAQCYYYHEDKVWGPINLFDVFEYIEKYMLPPDVPVMMVGSDYWRPANKL